MTAPASDINSMLSATASDAGSAPPSTGPQTISIGNDTPDSSNGTGSGQPAAPQGPQDINSLLHATASDSDSTPLPPQSGSKGGFVQGLGEGSGVGGIGAALKAAQTENVQKGQRALDIYHQMVAAHAKGDSQGAAEAASQFLLTTTQQGLQKAYAPFIEAAKMVIMDPVKAIQEQRAINQKTQADAAAGKENPNTMRAVWDRAKQDWKSNNPDAALTDVLAGTVGQPGMNAIPLVGPLVSSTVNHLNEATHAPGGEDYARIAGNVIGTAGTALLGEGVGKIGDLLPDTSRAGSGIAEGQAGADAAHTAADTAKAHDQILQSNKDDFKNQLDQSIQKAQDTKLRATEANKANTVETGNQNAERTVAHKDLITTGRDEQHAAIDDTLEKAKQTYAEQFKNSLRSVAPAAEAPEDMAGKVNAGINQYEANSHTDFENGMTGGNPKSPTPESVLGSLAGKRESP